MGCCSCVWFPVFLFLVSNFHRIVHRRDDRLRNSHTYRDCCNCQYGGQDLVVHICHILFDLYNYLRDGRIFDNCSNAMDWVWIAQLSPLCSLLLSSLVFWVGQMSLCRCLFQRVYPIFWLKLSLLLLHLVSSFLFYFISSIVHNDNSLLLTTPLLMFKDLWG